MFSGECPEGYYETSVGCHKVISTKANFHDANQTCTAMGAYLVTIESEQENSYIHKLLLSNLEGIILNNIIYSMMCI